MIYTITFNPALDYVVDVEDFTLGNVNRTNKEAIYCGGKGINVSAVLKELGHQSICLGFVAGFTGEEIIRATNEDLGLQTDFIKVDSGFSRINVKLRGKQESELNGQGPLIDQEAITKLYQKLSVLQDGDILILSGSIPKTLSNEVYKEVMLKLVGKDIKVIVDATGELLEETLPLKPFLIKPNIHELEDLFNVEIKTIKDIELYARKLQEKGATNVLISMAKDGSLLVDENGNMHRMGVCSGTLKNSVGAGDSMVAGFVAGYVEGQEYDQILKLATATGGATAFSDGLATKDLVNMLIKQLD